MGGEADLFGKFGQTIAAGKIIFKEGDEGEHMHILQSGRVKVSKSIAGKEQILAILEKGDFFGEMAIVNKVRRTATIITLDQVELLSFNRQGFLSMIEKNAKIALNIIDKLCRRLQNANVHIKHLAKKNAKGLVAMNLLYAFDSTDQDQGLLKLDRTVQDFTVNLELSNEQLEQLFEEFKRLGVITVEGNSLSLKDEEKLTALAEKD